MIQPTVNLVLVALQHKLDAAKDRDLNLFRPILTEGPTVIRLDLMADMLNDAEDFERRMNRRDLP